jgi:hypothetical protein
MAMPSSPSTPAPSSIKFALFARGEPAMPQQPELVGQIDGIGAAGQAAHLKVKDAAGDARRQRPRARSARRKTPHQAALRLLVAGCTATRPAGASPASAIAWCMARRSSRSRWCSMPPWSIALRGFIPLAPLHQPHNLAGIDALAPRCPACRRWPASTPPSTAASRTRPAVRPAARHHRRGRAALRLPRPVLRIHRRRAAAASARRAGRRPGHRRAPRQRRLDVRHEGAQEPGNDHGLHRGRRPDDGHPHRQPRPRRAALPDGLPRHGRARR